MHQTTHPKFETAERNWYIASAKGEVLGHIAIRIAKTLMGKRKASYSGAVDQGDFVVVTDIEKLVVTGNKAEGKIYRFHTGFIGGLQELSFATLHAHNPEKVLMLAVRRMLPKTRAARGMLKRLKMYKGEAHPHAAQNPIAL
jgi:large subunit ribosomal protein L13